MKIEDSYYDKTGRKIEEFDVLKVYHFTGARRKKHYMYKQVILEESKGKFYYKCLHLTDRSESGHWLKAVCKNQRITFTSEIVQGFVNCEPGHDHLDRPREKRALIKEILAK